MAARGWQADHALPGGQPPFTWLYSAVFGAETRFVAPFVEESSRYLREIPRAADGTVYHPRPDGGAAMLIDRAQEYLARMARSGAVSGDAQYFTECVAQLRLHRTHLRDPESGLYHQGRGWGDDPVALSPGAWSRGQGWLIRGIVESLTFLPQGSVWCNEVQGVLGELAAALLKVQDADGFWHALPHLPYDMSAREASGTGLIAHALARAVIRGWLPAMPYTGAALHAVRALCTCVTPEGVVLHACAGPGPLTSLDRYLGTFPPDEGDHGTAALLFAFAGALTLLSTDHSTAYTVPSSQAK